MKRISLLSFFLAGLLSFNLILSGHVPAAHAEDPGTVYYVSQSGGDDANDGLTEDTPWQTLAKVSGTTFEPGDRILLKAGERWTNETLVLHGSGTATNPITLSAYGIGSKPVISPQIVDSSAITLHNEAGWKVTGLELEKAMMGINLEYDNVYNMEFIWLEDLFIHDMDDTYNSNPNKYNHFSVGIAWMGNQAASTFHLKNITMKSIVFDRINSPLWQGAISRHTNSAGFGINARFGDITIQDLTSTNSKQWGYNFNFMVNATVTDISTSNVGIVSADSDGVNPYGIGGIVVAYSRDMVFDGVNIHNVSKGAQGYDGVGFDFEGGLEASNIMLRNAVIDGTDGAGLMIFNNGGVGGTAGAHADTVTITNFGRSPGNSSGGIKFFPDSGTGTIKNATIDRGSSNSPFIEGPTTGFTLENMTYIPDVNRADFIRMEDVLAGNWRDRFGKEGYRIEQGEDKLPDYVEFAVSGQTDSVVWETDSADYRALTDAKGEHRRAAAVYADRGAELVYDLNLKDGLVHQIALYMVDWNRSGLKQKVWVEGAGGEVLIAEKEISDFGEGKYYVFNAAGPVKVKTTVVEGERAVISGVFFGASKATAPMTVNKTSAAPKLDGNVGSEEWSSADIIEMSYEKQVANGDGSLIGGGAHTDLTGELRLIWDRFGLYLAGEVKDSEYFNPYGTGDPLNNNDVIQVTLDPLNKKTSGTADAYIFDFVPTSGADHSGAGTWFEHWKWGSSDYRAGVKVAGKLTGDGYALEAFIPWDALKKNGESFQVVPGMKMGIGLMIGDFKANGQLKGILTNFGQGENAIGDASAYRTVIFAEKQEADAVVSRGKIITASSNNAPSSSPLMAIDGNEATSWVAANGDLPQWLEVDLGRAYSLSRIDQLFLTNDPWKYTVQGSLNGEDWTTIVDQTANTEQGPSFTHAVEGTYRYVKLTMIEGWGNWATAKEFKVYTNEAILTSSAYEIDDERMTVSGVPTGEAVDTFKSKLAVVNATFALYKADGSTLVTSGKLENGMKLVLTSTEGLGAVVYTVKTNAEYSIDSSFKVGSVTNPAVLAGGQLLTGNAQFTNLSNASRTITMVVGLYDHTGTDGALVSFSYNTRTLAPGETGSLSAGFKLPEAIAGYKAKIFVIGGSDLMAPSAVLSEAAVLTSE